MAGRDRSLVARWNDPQTAQTDSANLSTGRNKWTQIAEHRKYDLSLFMITEWRRADRQTDRQSTMIVISPLTLGTQCG